MSFSWTRIQSRTHPACRHHSSFFSSMWRVLCLPLSWLWCFQRGPASAFVKSKIQNVDVEGPLCTAWILTKHRRQKVSSSVFEGCFLITGNEVMNFGERSTEGLWAPWRGIGCWTVFLMVTSTSVTYWDVGTGQIFFFFHFVFLFLFGVNKHLGKDTFVLCKYLVSS